MSVKNRCPVCGDISGRGVVNHLRVVHEMGDSEIAELSFRLYFGLLEKISQMEEKLDVIRMCLERDSWA